MRPALTPPWTHPGFRLVCGGREWAWPDLSDLAASLSSGPLVAGGGDLPRLVATLVAGWQREQPVALLRGGLPPPTAMTGRERLLLLETSGTTGTPRRVTRPFDAVLAGIEATRGAGGRWLLTYDPCGFAGLQVLLTAMRGGGTLLADPAADVATLVRLALEGGASHISATPSFWRLLLLSGATPPLKRITLGGEAADQPLLDALRARFPDVPLRCIYAGTEWGRLFTVADGQAGFPARWLTDPPGPYSFRIRNDILQVRVGEAWQETGDLVEIVGDRVLFRGRNDLVINVGGAKVNPALVEARLLSLTGVSDAVAYGIPSPITGYLVAADIVAPTWEGDDGWRTRVQAALSDLPPPSRPRRLRLLNQLPLSAAGKKRRLAEDA
ncbi:AMP-binding protein [Niveispirillum fermenti]|uniref:AMP-binding protein n=1 Tax=Niveispirillum fermenti TaxID=1233113 RepID=UPI003A838023